MTKIKMALLSVLVMILCVGMMPQLSANSSVGNHTQSVIAKGDHHGGHGGHHRGWRHHDGWRGRGWDGWGGTTYYRSYPYYYYNPGYNSYYYYDPYYYNSGSGLYFRFGF